MKKATLQSVITCWTTLVLVASFVLSASPGYPAGSGSGALDQLISGLLSGSPKSFTVVSSSDKVPFLMEVHPVRHVPVGEAVSVDFTASLTNAIHKDFQLNVTGSVDASSPSLTIFTIDTIKGLFHQKPLFLQQPITIAYSPQGWQVNRIALSIGEGTFIGTGSEENNAINLSLSMEQLPATMLALFGFPKLEGVVNGEAAVTGTVLKPRITGTGYLRDGYYEHLSTGTILQNIAGALNGQGNSIAFSDFTATDPSGGVIQGHGLVKLLPESDFPFTVSLDVKEATLFRTSTIEATVTGPLSIAGTTKEAVISGSLAIPYAQIRIPPPLPQEGTSLPTTEINARPVEGTSFGTTENKATFSLITDIDLFSPEGIHIQGRGLESRWQGSVLLSGPLSAQNIEAQLTLVNGSFVLFGKPVTLVEGIITFDGPPAAFPGASRLAIIADKKGALLTARIHLAGTVSSAGIFIDSSPTYSLNEIVSYVLFERSLPSITPAQAIHLGHARNSLATENVNVPAFMDQANRELHVERLDLLQPDNRPKEIDPTARGYIHEDVYVEVEEDPGGQPGQVTAEIELTPSVYLETEVGSDEEGGIGLIYKWRY